jgi:hypothetical protein
VQRFGGINDGVRKRVATATSAILDRFLDNAELVQIKGKSYRLTKNKSAVKWYIPNRTGWRTLKCPRPVHFEAPGDSHKTFGNIPGKWKVKYSLGPAR